MVGVVQRNGYRVIENCDSVFERDSVLAKVALRFRVIPLKTYRHRQRRSSVPEKLMSITLRAEYTASRRAIHRPCQRPL